MISEGFLRDNGGLKCRHADKPTLISKSNKKKEKGIYKQLYTFFNNSMKLMSACRHVGIRILRDDANVLIQIECVRGRNSHEYCCDHCASFRTRAWS